MVLSRLYCIIKSFNTSHVTLYHNIPASLRSFCLVSIHLMLLFIIYRKRDFCKVFPVSIHLMLLFIKKYWLEGKGRKVSIHLMLLFILAILDCNNLLARFNTSHVTLYPDADYEKLIKNMFQYISCYSLSVTQKQETVTSNSFNTSHVTLYL